MDISFHYFAVKTLAIHAGFDNTDAQRIATYSQYIDDFNWITYIDCKNLPDDIRRSNTYDLYVPNPLTLLANFNPAMTGFIGIIDMAFLLKERTQRFTVSPFHFVPPAIEGITKEIRTVPAIIGNGSLISNLLVQARRNLIENPDDRQAHLMRIGMLLHTFADTYAHQLFSGYNSWVNDVKIVRVTDNITGRDTTSTFLKNIEQENAALQSTDTNSNSILPYIGHMWAGHTPDLTNISFEMQYQSSENSGFDKQYARSNTTTFLTASKHILDFLRSCRNEPPMPEAEWYPISQNIAQAFLVEMPKKDIETRLSEHWHRIFADIDYSYSKTNVESGFYVANANSEQRENSPLGTNYTGEFYLFNRIADEMLIEMYGPQPRKAWYN